MKHNKLKKNQGRKGREKKEERITKRANKTARQQETKSK